MGKTGTSGHNAGHATQLDGRQSVGSAEFLEHAVDVILDRLLGEISGARSAGPFAEPDKCRDRSDQHDIPSHAEVISVKQQDTTLIHERTVC